MTILRTRLGTVLNGVTVGSYMSRVFPVLATLVLVFVMISVFFLVFVRIVSVFAFFFAFFC